MQKLLLSAFLTLTCFCSLAQGTVQGTVKDKVTSELLPFANIIVDGQTRGTTSDFDGNFSMELEAGSYTLICSTIGYKTLSLNVEVLDGESTNVSFNIESSINEIDVAEVETRIQKNKDIVMEQMKKKEASMMEYRSGEEMQKAGDSDASGALAKVTGVSTVGKYVFVRGLSDRYIKTSLNNSMVPSMDPKKNSVQMDIFPTSSIDNIVVVKTAKADLPADYSGAFINISTKDFPDSLNLSYSTSFGFNTNASFNDNFLSSELSGSDWLGSDNGSRDIPSEIGANGVPFVDLSCYYEALSAAGYGDLLEEQFGITDCYGFNENNVDITDVLAEIPEISSVSQLNDEYLNPLRIAKNQELSNITQSFPKTWDNERTSVGLDFGQSLSFGDVLTVFGRRLGYNFGFNYNKSNRFYENGNTGRYTLSGPEDEVESLNLERRLTDSQGTQTTQLGALINLNYQLNENNTIGFVYMPNRKGENISRYQDGINPSDDIGLGIEQRSQLYTERNLNIYQLKGNHTADNWGFIDIDWLASYTKGVQNTPDLRLFTNSYREQEGGLMYLDANGNDVTEDALALLGDGENLEEYYPGFTTTQAESFTTYSIDDNLYPSPTRFYRQMVDDNIDLKLDITVPLASDDESITNNLKFGGAYLYQHRRYIENRYSFVSNGIGYNGDPDSYFSNDNMSIDGVSNYLFLRDDTDIQNSYSADQAVIAGYAMLTKNFTPELKVNVGVRVENTDLLLESDKLLEENVSNEQEFRGALQNFDVLPSMNLTYRIHENLESLSITNLKVSASRSLARPMFREKAPYSVYDFFLQEQQTGNTNLDRTLVDNYDLRLEHYPSLGELLSVSLFYKNFQGPIEQVIVATASNTEITWQNVDRADLMGVEFEIRKPLSMFGESFKNFNVGLNATLVKSNTEINAEELEQIRATDPDHADTRPMFGQAPYVFNAIVGYDNAEKGLTATANFNYTGPKLVLVTRGGTPDVYDQARGNLSMKFSKTLGEHFSLSLKGSNLLNPDFNKSYEFKGQEYIWQSYTLGRTYSIGLTVRI